MCVCASLEFDVRAELVDGSSFHSALLFACLVSRSKRLRLEEEQAQLLTQVSVSSSSFGPIAKACVLASWSCNVLLDPFLSGLA